MRVIAGLLKGRRLVSFKASHLRPMSDRVKESVFNRLQNNLRGARVLDLFSGTGSLAIEAYSRGASWVECVEKHRKSIEIIKKNLAQMDIKDSIEVRQGDVLKYLGSFTGLAFDVVVIDPPFTQKLAHLVMERLAASQVVREGGLVAIESSSHERIDDQYLPFKLLDRKDFGDKCVSYFIKDSQ